MANPTSQVPIRHLPYGGDDKFYLPYPTGTADSFVNGEMIGSVPGTGYGAHFDDTQPLQFWGWFAEPDRQITTDLPGPVLLMVRRPRLVACPLASGSQSRGFSIGAPVYAANSGAVTLNPLTLTYANVVGFFVDIAAATPETISGATYIWVDPMPLLPRGAGMMGVLVGPATGGHTYGVESLNKTIEAPITGASTYTLPAIADTVAGDSIMFITTAGASVLTLAAAGSDKINGAATYALAAAEYSVAELFSDGTQWLLARKI